MSKWHQKRFKAVIHKWMNNQIGMADAAAELVWLGYSAEYAWDLLSRTTTTDALRGD